MRRARILKTALGALLLIGGGLYQPLRANYRPAETFAAGTVPLGINYQGRLSNEGALITGQRLLRFRVYDHPTAGTMLWESPIHNVKFEEGIFGVVLDIPAEVLMGAGLKYLETEVESIVLKPREPLRAVPYARIAEVIEGDVEISSGSLAISTAAISGEAIYVSSATGQVGFGTFSPVTGARVQVLGGDVVIGSPTLSGGSTDPDVFVPGNLVVGGAIIGGTGITNRVEVLAVSTETALGERFKVGEGFFTVRDDGRVGIRANDATVPLDIDANATPALSLNHAAQAHFRLERAGASRLVLESDASSALIQTPAGDDLVLESGGGRDFIVTSAGRVGLSTGSPQEVLDVNGSMRVTGSLALATSLSVSSGGTAGTSVATAQAGLNLPARDGSNASGTWGISVAGNAATFDAWSSVPAVCTTAGDFSTGVVVGGGATGCAFAAANVNLTTAGVRSVVYDDDNNMATLGSSWAVASSGAFDIFFDSPTFYIDVSANKVGIGTAAPSYGLDVLGGDLNASGKFKESGNDGIPAGAIAFATIPAGCPAGWSEFIAARGYMVVGLPDPGGTGVPGGTVGAALADLAVATHTHTLSGHTHAWTATHSHQPGAHTHAVSDPGTHSHDFSGHTHDNFDADGGVPHSHTATHQHATNAFGATLNSGDDTQRQGGFIGGSVAITAHTHSVTFPSFNSDNGTAANTNTTNMGNVSTGGSTVIQNTAGAAFNTNSPSGAPTSQLDRTANASPADPSAGPSPDAANGADVTFPYLQLFLCQKT